MKAQDIKVGGFYHDRKDGIREVVSITKNDAGADVVEYRLIAAKVTQEWSHNEKKMVSVIGTTSSSLLPSFATWAKVSLTATECEDLKLRMQSRKIKLPDGEDAFIRSAMSETEGKIAAGLRISIDATEKRAVTGLVKKGLVLRDDESDEAEFTALGAAWVAEHMGR